MAIIVEEEKNVSNLASSLGWILIIVIALVAAYFIVFVTPEPEVVTPPPSLANITAVGQITFDPASVINGTAFQSLKQYIPEPTSTGPGSVGRPNPFLPQ